MEQNNIILVLLGKKAKWLKDQKYYKHMKGKLK